jgi:hypothetical protein
MKVVEPIDGAAGPVSSHEHAGLVGRTSIGADAAGQVREILAELSRCKPMLAVNHVTAVLPP